MLHKKYVEHEIEYLFHEIRESCKPFAFPQGARPINYDNYKECFDFLGRIKGNKAEQKVKDFSILSLQNGPGLVLSGLRQIKHLQDILKTAC